MRRLVNPIVRPRVILMGCAIFLISTTSYADDEPLTGAARIDALNKEAITLYEAYSFTKGRQKLTEALEAARQEKISSGPELALTYGLLGMGIIAAKDDLYRGLHYLTRAFRFDKKLVLPKQLMTPQVLNVERAARRTVGEIGTPPTVKLALHTEEVQTAKKAVAKDKRGLVHEPVFDAKRNYPIPVKAVVGVDIRATHFYLYYRRARTVKYARIEMKLSRGAYRAAIPKTVTKGKYVHYFIEARDQRGRVTASMGSQRSPNVITIKYF
jgi:hypothetical protein